MNELILIKQEDELLEFLSDDESFNESVLTNAKQIQACMRMKHFTEVNQQKLKQRIENKILERIKLIQYDVFGKTFKSAGYFTGFSDLALRNVAIEYFDFFADAIKVGERF